MVTVSQYLKILPGNNENDRVSSNGNKLHDWKEVKNSMKSKTGTICIGGAYKSLIVP
jgi:hypothetical protein